MLYTNELISEDSNDLEYKEYLEIFNRALQALPSRLQTMLTLSRIKGLTNEEIADKLNISPKTVRNGISLGLKLLREKLNELRGSQKS